MYALVINNMFNNQRSSPRWVNPVKVMTGLMSRGKCLALVSLIFCHQKNKNQDKQKKRVEPFSTFFHEIPLTLATGTSAQDWMAKRWPGNRVKYFPLVFAFIYAAGFCNTLSISFKASVLADYSSCSWRKRPTRHVWFYIGLLVSYFIT